MTLRCLLGHDYRDKRGLKAPDWYVGNYLFRCTRCRKTWPGQRGRESQLVPPREEDNEEKTS